MRGGVLRLVERQARLPWEDGDEFLFGDERPGELIGAIRVEVDFDPPSLLDGNEPLRIEFTHTDLRCTSEPGGGTEQTVQRDRRVGQAGEEDYDGGGVHEERTIPRGINLLPRL